MSEIKALEELSKYMLCDKGEVFTAYFDTDEIIAKIEAEIAEQFIELPLDIDGVPIRVGDTVTDCEEGGTYTVSNVNLYDWGWRITGNGVDKERAECSLSTAASCLRHVKPRTLEDIIGEFGYLVAESASYPTLGDVRKCADEIRELLRGDV